jgi:hypothetical protein
MAVIMVEERFDPPIDLSQGSSLASRKLPPTSRGGRRAGQAGPTGPLEKDATSW